MSDKTSTEKKPTENKSSDKLKEKPDEAKVEGKPQQKKSVEVKSVGGLARLFNAETNAGRANVAKATYGAVFLAYLYFKLKGKKPRPGKPEKHVPHDHHEVGPDGSCKKCEPNDGSHDSGHHSHHTAGATSSDITNDERNKLYLF